ncbi:porin [Bradyrhizobium sp. SSUT18]|uniref:porin n=1 Tax=Bradyrhizobium sp. SSUT18 TaxID=3040602 RepID=UPI0024470B0B|nr:porin [Bradyrhizobium sp. SSUT18]MDH2406570.1 porin [Bradyrhizobium sp. SSUT18]
MKLMKSIIIGSAAMFAGAGAQAADLPVKAKAVEYVKICSLYGAGFYYIPGTDTCIKLGGYVRAETVLGSNGVYTSPNNGIGGAHNRLSNYYTTRARFDSTVDTRTATEYGVVRTYGDIGYSWTAGGYSGAGTTAINGSTAYTGNNPAGSGSGMISGGNLSIYYAFIQFAGFTFGRAQSQFASPWTNYPGNSYDGLPGGAGYEAINQFAYTADFGQGITASFSAEDQVGQRTTNIWNVSGATAAGLSAGAYGVGDVGGSRAPDFVGQLRVDQAWGLFQASVAAHDNLASYYGVDETTGHPSDKWGWAGQLALSIKNIPTGPGDTINIQGVYTNGATGYNFQQYTSATYAMYGGAGLAGAYQSVGLAGLSDSVFVAGAGQQLTTSYGFNGAYTHNWNPYWSSSVYGAWAAVRYNGTAKGYICGAFVATLALSSGLGGCNPDFNYAVIGTRTIWTPVKNLAFAADLTYVMLDQKYASGSTVTLPVQAGIAKPAGVYELKDQGALTLSLRATRSF